MEGKVEVNHTNRLVLSFPRYILFHFATTLKKYSHFSLFKDNFLLLDVSFYLLVAVTGVFVAVDVVLVFTGVFWR